MTGQRTGFFRHDGHRIAYATVGDGRGTPIVLPAWWVSNVVEDWKDERFRSFLQQLARHRQVIRYDRLGCGMSDRERPPGTMTVAFEAETLHALLEHLELERVSLVGGSWGGCVSIVYAGQHPERVERLVLYGTFADGDTLAPEHVRNAIVDVVRAHWGLGSRLLADAFVPSGDARSRDAFAAFQRRSADSATAADLMELMYATDLREQAAALEVPTLVVHRRGDRAISARAGEQLAALVPNAQFVLLDGDAHLAWEDPDDLLAAIAPFLGLPAPERTARETAELSPRERDVLRLVAEGLSDADIAGRLVLSPHTVHRHVANILRKLDLHSRAAAAAHAVRAGLV